MSNRWTQDEDWFLLNFRALDPDFIASHDLHRPHGAGSRRMKKLVKDGAVIPFLEMSIAMLKLEVVCGRKSGRFVEEEINDLEIELSQEIAAAGSKA